MQETQVLVYTPRLDSPEPVGRLPCVFIAWLCHHEDIATKDLNVLRVRLKPV